MKLLKKSTAIFMVLLTLFTMVPLSVFASDPYTTETQSEVDYKATNALGEVLSDAMAEEQTEQNSGYFILDVAIEDGVANVDYSAPDNSQLIVAIYNEEGTKMLTSAKADVDSTAEQTELDLDAELPEFFLVKAFILDSENKPVCRNFESIKYTQAFQEFLEKETTDFEEEKVINLDESTKNNFAVVSDEAQIIEQTATENTLTTNDYENGIYVFENANNEITDLEEGDVLYFVYGEGAEDYILTKVGSIENDDGTVTITAADEFEMSDFFSYIKIDIEEAQTEEPQSEYNLKRGGHYDDDSGDVDEESKEIEIAVSKSFLGDNYEVSFAGALKFKFYLQFYYDFNLFKEDYYEITQTATISFGGNTTIRTSAKKDFEPFVFFAGGIPVFTGIEAEVEVLMKITVSAELYVTGGIEFKMVNGSRKIAGKPDEDLSKEPSVSLEFDAGGKLSISLTPSVSIGFEILKIIDVGIGVEASFIISGTIHILEVDSGDDVYYPDEKHNCDKCIDGDIKVNISGFIKVEFGINEKKQKTVLDIKLFTFEKKLCDFYISIDLNILGEIENIKFAIGECPNIVYKVTFKVVDENSKALENVTIYDETNNIKTKSNGEAFAYFGNGTHTYSVIFEGYEIDTSKMLFTPPTFAVKSKAEKVNVYLKKSGEETTDPENPTDSGESMEPEDPGTVISSGECGADGDNVTWTLYEDGNLVISGSGNMADYKFSNAPWYTYRESIVKCFIQDGITNIGNYSFVFCEKLTYIKLPNSIKKIGDGVFNNCASLIDIDIPDSVSEMGYGVFGGCDNLVNIKIPREIKTLKNSLFSSCSNLVSLVVPISVISIDEWVFNGCKKLSDVYYWGTQEQWNKININFKYNDPLANATIHYNYTPTTPALLASPRSLSSPSSLLTETIESTTPGHTYLIAIVRDSSAEDVLSSSNLLYIDQKEAESDTITFSFELDEEVTDYDVLIYSADLSADTPDEEETTDPSEPSEDETTEAPSEEETTAGETEATTEPEELTTSETVETTEAEDTTAEETTLEVEETVESTTEKEETTTVKPVESTTKPTTSTKPTTTKKEELTTKAPVTTTTAPTTTPTEKEQPVVKAKKPAKVKIKKPKSTKKKQIVVSWNKVKMANGYQISYSTSKKFKKKLTKTKFIKKVKTTKTTLKKLKSGKKYFIKVRAYKTVNGKKIYGAYSKVMNVKVK